MQTKDIDKSVVLNYLKVKGEKWTLMSEIESLYVGVPKKLIGSTMKSLVKRGLVDGCCCGCRGDFVLTDLGLEVTK